MPRVNRKFGLKGLALLQEFEQGPKGSFAPIIYDDGSGNPTVGWGHKIVPKDHFDLPLNSASAMVILVSDTLGSETQANKLLAAVGVTGETQEQFDALVCLIFNAGAGKRDGIPGDIADSTLLAKWGKGDLSGAADQFLVWNKTHINGVLTVSPGLTRRRQAERWLFLNKTLKFYF